MNLAFETNHVAGRTWLQLKSSSPLSKVLIATGFPGTRAQSSSRSPDRSRIYRGPNWIATILEPS